jgi:UbiD family decarboxylase
MPRSRPALSLRDHLEDLESHGRLRRVERPVDKDWEIACIARWALEATREEDAYAIRFERVIGFDVPVVTGLFGSRELLARSLGIEPGGLWERFSAALAAPLAPRLVPGGPVKEVVRRGPDADVTRFPVPIWTPGRDRSPYLSSACVVTADRRHGVPNLGTYRVQVHGPRSLGLFFGSEKQHGAMHVRSFEEHGEPAPVALVVGAAPAVSYAAAAKVRYGLDEMTLAGGLLGQPIPLVRCESHRLCVPAEAELVIEGFVRPGERADEGPFGEALGYMEGVAPARVVEVSCITHRERPIFHGLVQQLPPSEGHLLLELGLAGSLWHTLRHQARIRGLVDLGILPGAAGASAVCLSVRSGDRESVRRLLRVLGTLHWGQKLVIVVDEDVDVHDPRSVLWALSSRVDFAADLSVQDDIPLFQRDPAALRRAARPGADPGSAARGARLVVDATLRGDCMAVSLPVASHMRRAREAWAGTGLPPLRGVARLERLLEVHREGGIEYHLAASKEETPR